MPRQLTARSVLGPLLLPASLALAAPLAGCTSNSPQDPNEQSGFQQIVYAVRQTTTIDGKTVSINVADGMGQVMDYGRYVPGARIELRNLTTGAVENIIEGDRYKTADVEGLDLSFDATKIVFAMKLDGNDNYHIYTANLAKGTDSTNPYGIRELTAGAYDDLTPVWVAGGRVAFITNQSYAEFTAMGTRADEYNHAARVTQIGTVTEVGGDADRKLCSQNLSHVFNLFHLQSGQIGYSRWEHLENVNDSKLFAMNPDCSQMVALAGQHGGKPSNSLVQTTETLQQNVFVSVGTSREKTIQAGALIQIDARDAAGDNRHDEERATYSVLTPGVPTDDSDSAVGRYRSPHVLPDGRIMVSWADGYVSDINELSMTPPDFGIYIYDTKTHANQLVYNDESTWELYAQAVAPTKTPPILTSVSTLQDATVPLTIGSIDVRQTTLTSLFGESVHGAQFGTGTPTEDALKQAVAVRIIEGFSSESAPNVTMFGLTMAEGAAVLGEAPVQPDGSWRAKVPPFIPMHLQPVDEFDMAIRSQTLWMQGLPGESRICGGCHESRTAPNNPTMQQLPLAAATPSTFMDPIAARTEYPWQVNAQYPGTLAPTSLEVQSIFRSKCVSCHNDTQNGNDAQEFYQVTMNNETTGKATTYKIARFDLSETPITVVYDKRAATYPMSYVSIFYPATLQMMAEMGTKVVGTVPPEWGIPSDSRNSKMIEKINVTSSIDASKTAWPLGQPFSDTNIHGASRTMHPDDVGVTLTADERQALIRAFDMGGQFYSRQNTGFKPDTVAAAAGQMYQN